MMPKRLFYFLPLLFIGCITAEVKIEHNPNDFEFMEIDIQGLNEGYQEGEFTIKEITQAYLERIEEVDFTGPTLRSIIQINPDALSIADQLDRELAAGKIRGPLHGIPVVLKDNIDTHDKMNTTAGSRAVKNSKPLQDSYVAKTAGSRSGNFS